MNQTEQGVHHFPAFHRPEILLLLGTGKRTPREFILSGTQQGSGMPGTMPTALTMLWMVAWLDGRTICKSEKNMVASVLCPPCSPHPTTKLRARF